MGADLAALMLAAQAGDQDSYRVLLEELQPVLRSYVKRRIRDEEAANDICQDVLLTMHRVRHTFEPGRSFEPWFYAIARSRFIDHLRRRRRRGDLEVGDDAVAEIVAEEPSAGWGQFLELLERLPESQREAFSMLKIEGLSVEEAAERAGVSISALKVRAHRAYGVLRRGLLGSEE
ncbi:MAG TPA: sigma-70 family RNA polymerase sigma factor [Candidatus Limnocylindrales bacterium]|nr:sigma-70 family RNA polymerase sigma factor [Candidatus Limnocylindrales bacterium]